MKEFKPKWAESKHPLVLFGSPDKGVPEILAESDTRVEDVAEFNMNTIPEQGVETVRTEEALMASLAVLNILDEEEDRKSTRLNSSHGYISYAVFCLKKKKNI